MGFLGDDNVTLNYEKEVRTTFISIKINCLLDTSLERCTHYKVNDA